MEKIKIDLGCGQHKKEGFIGIDNSDRNPLNGKKFEPDVKHDLNTGIHYEDNIVDEVYSSNFLQYADDPIFIMRDIYRVCKHHAIVEIKVPMYDVLDMCYKTCFFEQWFERNLDDHKFGIVKKEIKDILVKDPRRGDRTIKEIHITLRLIKHG